MRVVGVLGGGVLLAGLFMLWSQQPPRARDAVEDAQRTVPPSAKRPEQEQTAHHGSDESNATQADPLSPVFKSQRARRNRTW